MFFKMYTFSFERGRRKKLRLYSGYRDELNMFQYWIGMMLVPLLGVKAFRKPEDRSEEVSRALSR
jgi:hypothetical protein